MAFYCYWSPQKQSSWVLALASERENLVKGGKAEFITALDLDQDLTDHTAAQEDVRYRGDFYVDFDSPDIEETTLKVKEFLVALKDKHGVDPNQVRIYASGKKGYHVEIPVKVFIQTPQRGGYKDLAMKYREMAEILYVDTMDFAVYSGKRGRMWRVPNFKRPDTGTYKVQISFDEAMAMTPEWYAELVSAPRPVLELPMPTLSSGLSLVWSQACDRVMQHVKSKRKRTTDDEIFDQYKGEVPTSIRDAMNGEGLLPDVGFNQIAQQLAIAARVFRMSQDEFLGACQGLIDSHVSDSGRYASEGARKRELTNMYQYMQGNFAYGFSVAAIRSLLEHKGSDLVQEVKYERKAETRDVARDERTTLGVDFDHDGIYVPKDGGRTQELISHVGMGDVRALRDTKTRKIVGYDVEMFLDGNSVGRHKMSLENLASRNSFQAYIRSELSSSCHVTDKHVNALVDVLKSKVRDDDPTVYVVNREGLDIVPLPGNRRDYVWMESGGAGLSRLGESYAYMCGIFPGFEFHHKIDLLAAPLLLPKNGRVEDELSYLSEWSMEQLRIDLHNLLNMNDEQIIAKLLGWTIACFFCPALRVMHNNQFPLLYLIGSPNCGKSTTMRVLMKFHGYKFPPRLMSAGAITKAAVETMAATTNSIPFVVDEYKISGMTKVTQAALENAFKCVFDAAETKRGRLSKDHGDSFITVPSFSMSSPTAMISETVMLDTAYLQRCVMAPLTPKGLHKHSEAASKVIYGEGDNLFASIGRTIVQTIVFSDRFAPTVLYDKVREFEGILNEDVLLKRATDRQRYGLAVAALGLHCLGVLLEDYYGKEFSDKIDSLLGSLVSMKNTSGWSERAERQDSRIFVVETHMEKVLNALSNMSANKHASESARLVLGQDYAVTDDALEFDISRVFQKYLYVQRLTGQVPEFSTLGAFMLALDQYPGVSKIKNPVVPGMRNAYRLLFSQIYDIDHIVPFES